MAVDCRSHGCSGMFCSHGQDQDVFSPVAPEVILDRLVRQCGFFRKVQALHQMVVVGGEVGIDCPSLGALFVLYFVIDSSQTGWGMYVQDLAAVGTWTSQEKERHIIVSYEGSSSGVECFLVPDYGRYISHNER